MKRKQYVADGYVDLEKEVVLDKKGRRIDADYVTSVIEAAAEVRPVGRPSLDLKVGPSPQIAVRLPSSTYEHFKKVAQERGVTPAALTRQAVEEFLNRTG